MIWAAGDRWFMRLWCEIFGHNLDRVSSVGAGYQQGGWRHLCLRCGYNEPCPIGMNCRWGR